MNIRDTLLGGGSLKNHFDCYDQNREQYVSLAVETRSNKTVAKVVKNTTWTYVLTVILQNKDRDAFKRLMPHLQLLEVVRACEYLDTPRLIKQLEKKLSNKRHNPSVIRLRQLQSDVYPGLTLTRSKIEIVRGWVKSLTERELIFQALMFPKQPWVTLSDLCHLNPQRDFALDWFLPYCYGTDAPSTSVIGKLKAGDPLAVCKEYSLNYELARNIVKQRTTEFNKWYAENEPLETVLWYYDEFTSQTDIIVTRLQSTDKLELSYGKLVDLMMKTVGRQKTLYDLIAGFAQKRLGNYKMDLESPVAVFGDASSSMQVAINTSSIVTSLLTTLADAELHLFKSVDIPIDNPPRTVEAAVTFANKMSASGCTSPAASMYYYYKNKKAVKTIIIVTDEEENTGYNGRTSWGGSLDDDAMFAKLYNRYCSEVGPAKLIFVSFTPPNGEGDMIRTLKKVIGEKKVAEYVQVYKFDSRNPDLNKLDYILEKLGGKPAESDKPTETVQQKGWLSGWFA